MKQILIVHPSRGRPEQAKKIYDNIFSTKTAENEITNYIICADNDDPTLSEYRLLPGIQIITGDNNGCVQATNRAYDPELVKKHDIVILASDDIYFPQDWDKSLVEIFEKVGYDKAIKVTCQYQGDLDNMNLQIGGFQFFLDYGTFFWPEYISMFGDQDMTNFAKTHGRYIPARHLFFPHMQYSLHMPTVVLQKYGEIPGFDSTYERENSGVAWDVGSKVFYRRAAEGFPPLKGQ